MPFVVHYRYLNYVANLDSVSPFRLVEVATALVERAPQQRRASAEHADSAPVVVQHATLFALGAAFVSFPRDVRSLLKTLAAARAAGTRCGSGGVCERATSWSVQLCLLGTVHKNYSRGKVPTSPANFRRKMTPRQLQCITYLKTNINSKNIVRYSSV